jgi:FkbM family methyltransferase
MNIIGFLSNGHIKGAELIPSIAIRIFRLVKKKLGIQYQFVQGLPISNEKLNIVDVGANKGQFCEKLLISYPNAKVLAIEPQTDLAFQLLNKFATDRLIVRQCGLGEANYKDKLNVMSESGASSFKRQHIKHSKTNPHLTLVNTTTVEIRKGDDVINEVFRNEDIFLAKIDVEGFELNCLKGLQKCLPRINFILIEISSVRTDSYLKDILSIMDILSKTHDFISLNDIVYDEKGWIVQADYLFKLNHI